MKMSNANYGDLLSITFLLLMAVCMSLAFAFDQIDLKLFLHLIIYHMIDNFENHLLVIITVSIMEIIEKNSSKY